MLPSLQMCIAVGGKRAHRWASKRAMLRAARAMAMAMAMATKRAIATVGNNTCNGDGKAGGKQTMVATLAIGRVTAQRTLPLTQCLERGG